MNGTPLTPPDAAEAPRAAAPVPGSAPARSTGGGALAITIVTAVVGGLAIVGTGSFAAVAATSQFVDATVAHGTELDADGVTALVVEASASDVLVRFDDVPRAQLEVSGSGRGHWEMSRDGDVLEVTGPRPMFGWWLNGWWTDPVSVTITLPEELGDGDLDAALSLSAGELHAIGDFDDLTLDVSAGLLAVEGSARTVTAEVSAGRAELRDLADVDRADLHVSAGRLEAVFTGRAPADLVLSVSAGGMDITLPRGPYAVSSDISAGSFDNRLTVDPASRNRVQVDVSAGGLTLRESR